MLAEKDLQLKSFFLTLLLFSLGVHQSYAASKNAQPTIIYWGQPSAPSLPYRYDSPSPTAVLPFPFSPTAMESRSGPPPVSIIKMNADDGRKAGPRIIVIPPLTLGPPPSPSQPQLNHPVQYFRQLLELMQRNSYLGYDDSSYKYDWNPYKYYY